MTKSKPYLDRAEKLKNLRGNVSIEDFSKELGINITTYYRYERGETPVSDGHLKLAEIVRMKISGAHGVSEPEPAYDPHGGYTPDPEKSLGVQRGTQQWKAFELLSKIYASQDQGLINAIFSNLKSFSESAERKQENLELKRNVEDLSARLNEVVAQLNRKGIVQLKDRRSGGERRHNADPAWPEEQERRDGRDRRKAAPE